MLRLLAEDENNIRRSVNPRLAVETMLLRWALMDRVVDLEEVLEAGGGTGRWAEERGPRGRGAAGQQSTSTGRVSSGAGAEPPRSESAPQPRSPAAPPSAHGQARASIEAIRAGWPAIIVAARVQSRFLGELLAAVEPAELVLPWLNVTLREPNQLFAERLEQEARTVEEILTRTLGQPVRLRVTGPNSGRPPSHPARAGFPIPASKPSVPEFRAKDPALDTAADALDLEIVD